MNAHFANLFNRYPKLIDCAPEVTQAFGIMRDAFQRGRKLLLCGNGGSAADADHWAGELLKAFVCKRPLSRSEQSKLPGKLGLKLEAALPAIPLTSFASFSTAFGNDVDPQLTFAQLVWGLGTEGDVLVGISTSGNARNVCAAMEAARARRMHCIGLSGRTGGSLNSLCDVCIKVPASETYQIQELHLPIYHCLSLMLETEFFGNGQ